MSINRSNINLGKTLLILLGILIAFLLMAGTKSIDDKDLTNHLEATSKTQTDTLFDTIDMSDFIKFVKKVTSLN